MDRSLFEFTKVPLERLARAASDLTDRQWAGYCLDAGLREIQSGKVSPWVPRLALVAAHRLDRAAEFLPHYEHFLGLLDSASKGDWHGQILKHAKDGNLLDQSGRLGQAQHEFEPEFQRIVLALGPPDAGLVADVGCGGGLWAIRLAKMGYRVIGTERYESLVESARRNAAAAGVGDLVEFRLDDICNSALPAGLCPRALCIGVTPTLPDAAAFDSLLYHLDRITRQEGKDRPRRVLLGSNRWAPSRMTAVRGILDAAADRDGASWRLADAMRLLYLVELSWWLEPHHQEAARLRFPSVERIGETHDQVDGTRVDFLLS